MNSYPFDTYRKEHCESCLHLAKCRHWELDIILCAQWGNYEAPRPASFDVAALPPRHAGGGRYK